MRAFRLAGLLLMLSAAACSLRPPAGAGSGAPPAPEAAAGKPDTTRASAPPPAPAPAVPAPQEPALPQPQPPATPPAPATGIVTPPAAVTAPKVAAAPKIETVKPDKPAAKPPAKPSPPTAKPQAPAAPAPLALTTLEQRLKDTPAIGVFTKITLKNQVDELLDRFRDHYEGRGGTLAQLRQSYEQLLSRVHGLLKDGDPALAAAIVNSREAIWNVLTDPAKFAKL